jgi:pimeloyl-ACP methyl ester carboxylesterase
MTYFDFEGHKVFYERQGSGEPIVFLPNATLDGKLWEFQADYLKATHDVIVVDLPGFGRSDRITPSLDLWVRWLGRFVDELELVPVALVGNCMGSLTALHYGAANPAKVNALVLIHTLDNDVGMAGPMGGGGGTLDHTWLRPVLEWMVRHQPAWTWEKHPGAFNKMATVYPSSQFGDILDDRQAEYTAHAFERFAEVDTRLNLVRLAYTGDTCTLPPAELLAQAPPICWIWAEANKLLLYHVGRRQLDALKPDEVHVIPGRGYAVAWEVPEIVNPIIESFLDRHSARTTAHPKAG